MSNIYPAGFRIFPAHENAPDFVKGTVIIIPKELIDFCKDNADLLTDYKGTKQLKCQLKEGNKGLYLQVDTYKKPTAEDVQAQTQADEEDDLGF